MVYKLEMRRHYTKVRLLRQEFHRLQREENNIVMKDIRFMEGGSIEDQKKQLSDTRTALHVMMQNRYSTGVVSTHTHTQMHAWGEHLTRCARSAEI